MELIVFAGPSLGRFAPSAAARIDLRPPAACGDIARAVALRPRAIGLIDGLFETTASVWHKELVFALAEGIAVYGAASMGAAGSRAGAVRHGRSRRGVRGLPRRPHRG
ncbi:MAG: hypothetical protein J0H91_22335 [Rhodospirillales bacterium]|nr:hypothetical protein [Rhodospirillales bacterium]